MPKQRSTSEAITNGAPQKAGPAVQDMASLSHPYHPDRLRSSMGNLRGARPETILQLQRQYGNRAVSRMLAGARGQAAQPSPSSSDSVRQTPAPQPTSGNVIQRVFSYKNGEVMSDEVRGEILKIWRGIPGIKAFTEASKDGYDPEETFEDWFAENPGRLNKEQIKQVNALVAQDQITVDLSDEEIEEEVEKIKTPKLEKSKKRKISKSNLNEEYPSKKQQKSIIWNDKEFEGSFKEEEFEDSDSPLYVYSGGFGYPVINSSKISKKMIRSGFTTKSVKFKKPFTHSKLPTKEKDKVLYQGVLITSIDDEAVTSFISKDVSEYIIEQQDNAEVFMKEKSKPKNTQSKKYRPVYKEKTKYAVKWKVKPPKKIIGTTDNRTMVKSLDVGFKTSGSKKYQIIKGDDIHAQLFKNKTLHGNKLAASFSLSYQSGGLKQTSGNKMYFGSGKTKGGSEKSKNTDDIATMLVDSGQLSSVDKYKDEHHAHSEQSMIVYLSKHLDVFDEELAEIEEQATVITLVVDIYSDPNTVCDKCHPSLEIFLTKSDWKDKVIQHLNEKKKKSPKITIEDPPVLLRVSSNKAFSASAREAIKTAKEQVNLDQDKADIFFIEGVPREKYY